MLFNATPEDFLKGTLINPGIYPAEITGYEEKLSTGGWDEKKQKMKEQSMYIEMTFKILIGEFAGKEIKAYFSEKAATTIVPLLEALGANVDKTKPFQFQPSKDKFINKRVDIHIIPSVYQNKPTRVVDGYRKYTGPEVTKAPAQAGV